MRWQGANQTTARLCKRARIFRGSIPGTNAPKRKLNRTFCKKWTVAVGGNGSGGNNMLEMHLFFLCVNFFKKSGLFVRSK
jgi:hypothetical protein